MIYKFIDNNGSEITVNSLSSIKGLIESETIKENTKVKDPYGVEHIIPPNSNSKINSHRERNIKIIEIK